MPKCQGCTKSVRSRDLKAVDIGEDEDAVLCPKCRKSSPAPEEETGGMGASVFQMFQGGKGRGVLRNKFSYKYDGDGYSIVIELNEKGCAVAVDAGPFEFKVSTKWKALNSLLQGAGVK